MHFFGLFLDHSQTEATLGLQVLYGHLPAKAGVHKDVAKDGKMVRRKAAHSVDVPRHQDLRPYQEAPAGQLLQKLAQGGLTIWRANYRVPGVLTIGFQAC
eukprot:1163503-Prorocentrum_minimum.AAC.1